LYDRENGVIGGVYNHLIPDNEYTFRVYYNASGADVNVTSDTNINDLIGTGDYTAPTDATEPAVRAVDTSDRPFREATGAVLNGGAIRLRTKKGSNYIQSARVKTTGRGDSTVYDVVIETRAQYGTNISDVEYSLAVTGSKTGTFNESTHTFEVGWPAISDDETEVGEDGVIIVTNDTPVITKSQFADISRSANYKTVNFEGEDGGWKFAGRTSGMASSNFYYTYDVVPEIINKFPDQDYKFLSFKSGVTFPTNGEMRIDASDLVGEFDTIYTYLFRNGKLVEVDTTYDSNSSEIVFRTNYLGTFVLTSERIRDTTIIESPSGEDNEEPTEKPTEKPTNIPSGSDNPSTGAPFGMNLGVVLGLSTLVGAAAVSRKRK
jgi:LPXTG-motif cell wall-anchored protein